MVEREEEEVEVGERFSSAAAAKTVVFLFSSLSVLSLPLFLYLCFGFEVKLLFPSLVPELERAVTGVLRVLFFQKGNAFQTIESSTIDVGQSFNHTTLLAPPTTPSPYLDLELAAQEMLEPCEARSHEDQQGSSDDEEAGSGAPAGQRRHAQKTRRDGKLKS